MRFCRLLCVLSLALSGSSFVAAQSPGTGFYALGSFDAKGFDSINLGNLNTQFSIPVVSRPGRGLGFNYAIQYEGLVWGTSSSTGTSTWVPDPNWGFSGLLNGMAVTGYLSYSYQSLSCPTPPGWPTGSYVPNTYKDYNYTFHDSFGGTHLFNYTNTAGCPDGGYGISASSTGDGSASDGSGYRLSGNTVIAKRGSVIVPAISPTGQSSSSITDSNGNIISNHGNGTFTDTLGVTALTIAGSNPLTFTYPVTLQANNATTASASISYRNYTVRTNFQCPGIVEYGSNSVALTDRITLADGNYYSFTYEATPGASDGAVTARLASITLPTGGTISYGYSGGCNGSGINADGTPATLTRTTSDGSKTYARSINASTPTLSTTTTADEKQNAGIYHFVSNTAGFWYEGERTIWQGSNMSATPLQDRVTQYNSQAQQNQITSAIFLTDVFEQFNGGVQSHLQNSFDASGNLTGTTQYDSSGAIMEATSTTYNALGEVSSSTSTDKNGSTIASTTYGYDETSPTATSGLPQHVAVSGTRGNQTSSHISTGSGTLDTTVAYYDTGMPVSTTTANGTTQYGYDSTQAFTTQTTLPTPSSGVSLATAATYDQQSGMQISATGMNAGQTTQVTQYDALLRPLAISQPNGGQTSFAFYTANDSGISQTMGNGQSTSRRVLLDGYGRQSRLAIFNGQGNNVYYQTDSCYDPAGMLQFQPVPYQGNGYGVPIQCSGNGTSYVYDALGRVTSITNPDGAASVSYTGRAIQTTDVNNVQKITQYDFLGRISGVCEISSTSLMGESPTPCGMDIPGTGYVTSYTYDLPNHKTTITQGAQQRVFQTDAAGRTVMTSEPERGTTNYTYSYNTTGLIVVRTRPQNNPANSNTLTTTTTQYDRLGRVLQINYDDGITLGKSFQYDQAVNWGSTSLGQSKGKLTYASTTTGVFTGMQFTYDMMGNITSTIQCLPGRCGNSNFDIYRSYGYNYTGDRTSESFNSSACCGTAYSTSFSYSPAHELTSIADTITGTLLSNVTNGPLGPASLQYGNGLWGVMNYDTNGRVGGKWLCSGSSSPQCGGGTELYATQQTIHGNQVSSMNDTADNSQINLGYDEFNRLTSASYPGAQQAYSYGYDRYGNRWSQNVTQGSGPRPQYSFNTANNKINGAGYDAAGNMSWDGSYSYTYDAEGNLLSVNNGSVGSYIYDAFNHRVQSSFNSFVRQYGFDINGKPFSTWDGQTASPSLLKSNHYWNGQALSYFDGNLYYQHQDALGTERVRTNSGGSVTETFPTLAFGDGSFFPISNTETFHYATLDRDIESNTDHAQFRQYSPTQGRWMSPDPYDGSYDLGNPQSLNRYSYVLNNPMAYTDPVGLESCNSEGCIGTDPDPGDPCHGDPTGCKPPQPPTPDPPNSCYPFCSRPPTDPPATPGNPGGNGPGGGAPSNGTPGSQVSSACQAQLLGMLNAEHGTNLTDANVTGTYNNGTAANLLISATGLTAAQFNSFQPGRYSSYGGQFLLGFGMAGHIANEPGVNPGAVFNSSNIGGNLSVSFAFHDDHGYANNPIGALIHFFTDVLGHNSRKPC